MTTPFDPRAVAIGRVVRGALATADLTVAEGAEQTGMALRTFSRRVNGDVPFTFPELMLIADVCGTKVSDLAASAERIIERSGSAA